VTSEGPEAEEERLMVEVTAGQLRAARELVGWSPADLAKAAAIRIEAIADFESGARAPRSATVKRLLAALEARGVEFTNGVRPGVKLKAKARTIAAGI
jgi:ribosome-binding protein aMBF1 (putative translation factor)